MHTLPAVYSNMLLHVCRWYTALPDPRSLTAREIRFFYDGLREELIDVTGKRVTKPRIPRTR